MTGDMLWHWVFSLAGGLLGGWSLARLQAQGDRPAERGQAWRIALSAGVALLFLYDGWRYGWLILALTAGLMLVAFAGGYVLGRTRIPAAGPRDQAEADDEPPPQQRKDRDDSH